MEIPITAKAALLQALLVDGPGYGTELTERIETRTNGVVKLLQGSIYPALDKFLEAKIVKTYTAEAAGGRARVYYELTAKGKKMAEIQQAMMLTLFNAIPTDAAALAATRAANVQLSMKHRKAVKAEKADAA